MKAIPIHARYYCILDEDFYAALRCVTAKADIGSDDCEAFKTAIRISVGVELSLKEREESLREADRLSDQHPAYLPYFQSLAGYMRCAGGDIEPMRSLADFYMWRKAGKPPLHGIRHGQPRPQY